MRKRFYASEPLEKFYCRVCGVESDGTEESFKSGSCPVCMAPIGKAYYKAYYLRYGTFCYCPCCGVESYGTEESFKSGRCPVCEAPICKSDAYYLSLADSRGSRYRKGFQYYNTEILEFTKYNEREEFENLPDEEKRKLRFLSLKMVTKEKVSDPSSIEEVAVELDVVFNYMYQLREESSKQEAQDKVSDLIEQYSVSGSDGLTVSSPAAIKNDTEMLKTYIQNLIRVETNLYSTQMRLCSLYMMRQQNEESYKGARYQITAGLQDAVDEAEKNLSEQDYNITKRKVEMEFSQEAPKAPSMPVKPVLQQANFFNRKRVEAENAALMGKYENEMEEYNKNLAEYEEKLTQFAADKQAFEEEKARQEQLAQIEFEQAVAEAKKKTEEELEAAKRKLAEGKENIDFELRAELAKIQLLDHEIAQAEGTLKALVTGREELYAYNVIFPKYRNFVALSTFYEYLLTGRCSALEGADGAYNLYESEVRANLIIAKLADVVQSLEEIKDNQYTAYSQLRSMNSSLDKLNARMNEANEALAGIKQTGETMSGYMQDVASNTAVIAYNAEVTAYYSKKSAELTDALGFMTALK